MPDMTYEVRVSGLLPDEDGGNLVVREHLQQVVPDVRRVLWEKYLLIGAQAGMTALTRAPIGASDWREA